MRKRPVTLDEKILACRERIKYWTSVAEKCHSDDGYSRWKALNNKRQAGYRLFSYLKEQGNEYKKIS